MRSPRQAHLQRIDELESRLRATCDVLVGVHIRRGDYRHFMGGKWYYELGVFLELMSKIPFLICSDEPLASVASKFNAHFGPNHVIEDMYLLARCDYLIGPPSTY